MTEHDRQVLRSIYGRGLPCSIQPAQAKVSIDVLLSQRLIERGADPHPEAGSLTYRVTDWGRTVLGVASQPVQ